MGKNFPPKTDFAQIVIWATNLYSIQLPVIDHFSDNWTETTKYKIKSNNNYILLN